MLQHRTGRARGAIGAAVMEPPKNLLHLTHRLEFLFKIGKLLFHHFLYASARPRPSGIQPHEFTDLAQSESNFLRLTNEAKSPEGFLIIFAVARSAPCRLIEQLFAFVVADCLRVNAYRFCEF